MQRPIFGTDYDTRDGTCIRDYVHVCDLAAAHVKGVEYLLNGGETSFFNLGNGSGFTVKEVIETARQVTGKEIKTVECDRRPGDPPSLVGTSDRAQKVLNWTPQYPDLENIITHAWQWHQKRHAQNPAHKLARIFYHLWATGESYADMGVDAYDTKRSTAATVIMSSAKMLCH